MLRMFHIALFAAIVMGGACKSDKPAATKPEDKKLVEPTKTDPPKLADDKAPETTGGTGANTALQTKGIEMMQKMGDIFAANAKDCDKLALEIKNFVAANKALLTEWNAMQRGLNSAERTALEVRNKAVQDSVMAQMTPAVQACASNENFQTVLREIPTE